MPVRRRSGHAAPILAAAAAAATAVILLAGDAVEAQPVTPIGPFVVDVRGILPSLPSDDATAAPRDLDAAELPSRGLGVELGAHAFPLRARFVTLGVGASVFWSRRTRSPETIADTEGRPSVTTRMSAFSPQVSLNFGTGNGWSYISGGIGTATLSISRSDRADDESGTVRDLNYGAGARWFFRARLAFTVDIRFHSMNGAEPAGGSAGFPKKTNFAAAAGVSLR